jgi:hypothetical protein
MTEMYLLIGGSKESEYWKSGAFGPTYHAAGPGLVTILRRAPAGLPPTLFACTRCSLTTDKRISHDIFTSVNITNSRVKGTDNVTICR